MGTRDLETLSRVGQALWPESTRGQTMALETWGALSLQNLSLELRVERATTALLSRAEAMSASAGNFAFDQPFYRLSSEERVLLFVLHFGKWSYERVGRVVGKSKEAVAELVWSARMDLAFQPGQTVLLMHPFGTDAPGSRDCPEYYPRRPWTQNFLDEQLQAQEKHFLTAHLIECQRCQQALNRTRQIYYAVEAILPKTPDLDARVALFENILLKGRGITDPSSLSPHESLQIFFDRPETKRFLFGAIVFLGIVLFWWN